TALPRRRRWRVPSWSPSRDRVWCSSGPTARLASFGWRPSDHWRVHPRRRLGGHRRRLQQRPLDTTLRASAGSDEERANLTCHTSVERKRSIAKSDWRVAASAAAETQRASTLL